MGILRGIDWLLRLDVRLELFLNQFVGRYPWLDTTITNLNAFTLVNSVVVVFFLWLVLFDRKRSGQLREGFDLLIGSAFFSLVATMAARVLTFVLPFRDSPSLDPSIGFHIPGHIHLTVMTWSSIPSDQATLFFALASGIFMVSRRVGCIAIAWVSLDHLLSADLLGNQLAHGCPFRRFTWGLILAAIQGSIHSKGCEPACDAVAPNPSPDVLCSPLLVDL